MRDVGDSFFRVNFSHPFHVEFILLSNTCATLWINKEVGMKGRMVLKVLVLGVITLVLMAILSAISGLTSERRNRLHEVERDIASSYAGSQRIGGPVFAVRFREFWTEKLYNGEKDTWYDKERNAERTRLVYPADFSYTGSLSVQERYRGIFKANVFQSEGRISGHVTFPPLEDLVRENVSRTELVSVNACFMVKDPRGIASIPQLNWGGQPVDLEAGSTLPSSDAGIHASLPDVGTLLGNTFDFEMDLKVYGTGRIEFVPVGDENHVELESAWPHPSFTGQFLASNRTISANGFSAVWDVNSLACSAQKSITSGDSSMQAFGVSLIDPISPYPLTDRALKYGFLFIFITFAAFWLFEVLAVLKIHPVQYGFIGLAQAIFFLLLLSLSEHVGFGISYAVASMATIGLIVFYVCHILHGLGRGLSFGALLTLLYGVLYVLLQSEDHALIAGSTLLFGLVSLVMMLTRKVDWYALTKADATAP